VVSVTPVCTGCDELPIDLYNSSLWEDDYESADEYVKGEEGTYNEENGHFLCDNCYIVAGCPSSPFGWIAP
jgi:hypothetical protein